MTKLCKSLWNQAPDEFCLIVKFEQLNMIWIANILTAVTFLKKTERMKIPRHYKDHLKRMKL
ncbi:CLUMA_CG008893, isoform A [Clunio marinus]|uniref:CLUMA_CG008893, isoform A n=1 Tax=Clunio marinus TaxID=568069 RepID=A0A1J1I8R3_9DIPT|nr:CLUMA_CG008893, isoform A [Clunio marinus]